MNLSGFAGYAGLAALFDVFALATAAIRRKRFRPALAVFSQHDPRRFDGQHLNPATRFADAHGGQVAVDNQQGVHSIGIGKPLHLDRRILVGGLRTGWLALVGWQEQLLAAGKRRFELTVRGCRHSLAADFL